ncbi:MAG: alpha/beta fold hydrolase [Dehalococcoidia bacterium]
MYYEQVGHGGPPLLLVHGSWGDHHNWDAVVPALAQQFTVVTYDRRGHSQSAGFAHPATLDEHCADLVALVEQLDLAPAHIAGNSFGALLSVRVAAARPELFRSLVAHEPPLLGLLLGEPGSAPLLAGVGARLGAVVARLQAGDLAGGAQQFVDEVALGPGAWERLPEAARQTFIQNAPTFLAEPQDPRALTVDLAAFSRFPHPVLLTQGGQSPPLFAPIMDKLAQALPQAERHTFPAAGHVPHQSHPDSYGEVVTRFLAALPTRS